MGNMVSYDTTTNSNTFCLTNAHGCATVYLTFFNPDFPDITLVDSLTLCVSPGPASHLVAEGTPDTSGTSRYDNPLSSITIAASATEARAYAILRDQYENFVSHDASAQWTVLQGGNLISVAPGNTSLGEGVITKKPGADSGMAVVRVCSQTHTGASFCDTDRKSVV